MGPLSDELDPYMSVVEPSRFRVAVSQFVPVRMVEAWRVTGPPGVDFGEQVTYWAWRGREWGTSIRLLGSPATS